MPGSVFPWTGIKEMFEKREIMDALGNTLTIAFWAAVISTIVGVLACLGLNAMKEKEQDFPYGAQQHTAS